MLLVLQDVRSRSREAVLIFKFAHQHPVRTGSN